MKETANPRIELLAPKKLIGKRLRMSLSKNRTGELWKAFMSERRVITNACNSLLISMQRYDDKLDLKNFNQDTEFEKWAAVEVSDHNYIPEKMEAYNLEGGLYAVFIHKGDATSFNKTFQLIFHEWLPDSEYDLDNREHFELLGDKYKNNDPASEEEVWIPIKKKLE